MNTKTEKETRTQQLKKSDVELWRQVKAAAALEGCTMTEWVEKVLSEKLDTKSD